MNHFANIAARLADRGLDAMLVTSEPGEFYAAGFHGEGAALITKDKTWYWTDSRYIEAAGQIVGGAEIDLLPAGSSYRKLVEETVAACGIQKLGFEGDYMSVSAYELWKKDVSAQLVSASDLMEELRMVKDPEEVALMRAAQKVTDAAFAEILDFIRPGLTEQEISARLQYIMLRMGAERMAFDPIVAAGANGSKPHAVPSDNVIEKGQFITLDFGAKVDGYCSDMTRTIAVGQPTDEMRLVYDTVLAAQLAGMEKVKGGVLGSEVHNAAAQVIADAGYGAYFGHGYGHSLGIEIHESPRFAPAWPKPIPAGALLSAEPGIYIPGKFGVRIEDVLLVTEEGYEDITHSPKELIIL